MGRFRTGFAWIAVLLLSFALGGRTYALMQEGGQEGLLKAADEITLQVARIRGLEPKAPIKRGIETREEIARYLDRRVKEDYDEKDLLAEGRLLEKLGLIPEAAKYKDLVMKLLTEQVGGYYDPDEKTLFIAGWLPIDQQRPVMAHEIAHALQDQYFDLGRMIKLDLERKNDDEALAHRALAEGDGMAVMLDYLLQPAGKTFVELPDLVFVMRSQLTLMESQFAVFREAPVYLKESLLFPYGYGAAFLQKARANGRPWSAVDKIYSDLPESTEQIMHPDKYFVSRDKPKQFKSQELVGSFGDRWHEGYSTVLGEFSMLLLLKLHLPEERAGKAAEGWGGDRVVLIDEAQGQGSFVLLDSIWDTDQDAEEFRQALEEWLPGRLPNAVKSDEPGSGSTYAEGDLLSFAQRRGLKVRMVLGIPRETVSRLGP
jgi:hypothetical protein